jgi:hypothetical protein
MGQALSSIRKAVNCTRLREFAQTVHVIGTRQMRDAFETE